MGLSHSPRIVTDSLVLCLDNRNIKSYPGSGTSWNDLITQSTFLNSNYSWANNINEITIIVCLEKIGTSTSYASHPVNKWNSGTSNASFVLYHFGNFNNNNDDGRFSWYYTTNSTWTGKSVAKIGLNQKMFTAFQWNSSTGGQTWYNGAIASSRSGSGTLGVNGSSVINISGPIGDSLNRIDYISFYNRDLSNAEIQQNFNALRGRFGI